MFCKYCGKAIDEGTMRCRICGRPVGPLEGGNGFWDLKEERKAPVPAAAPAPAPAAEKQSAPAPDPVPVPPPQASAEAIPTAAAASPADNKAIRELRSQVKKLQEQVRELTPQKRGALIGGAILLALLALALGVFVLVQLRTLNGKVQELELQLARNQAAIEAVGQASAQPGQPAGTLPKEQSGTESKWQGFDQLDGIRLFSRQDLFDGPNKGKDDPRGQSIKMGLPDNGYEETPIFTARYLGPAGTYRYYWVKVEANDATLETYFTPLKEEDGYSFRVPDASDSSKTFVLSISGEVKQEHLGRYAFVAEDTQTQSAYVSAIVELYDRSEQGAAVSQAEGSAAGDSRGQESGAGNGN